MIQLKRAYEKPDSQDGFRVFVEPYWPRDLAEKDAKFDQWLKEVAPSAELHQRLGSHPTSQSGRSLSKVIERNCRRSTGRLISCIRKVR